MTTVKDLIKQLSTLDPDLPVVIDIPRKPDLEDYAVQMPYDVIHNNLKDIVLVEKACQTNREPGHSFDNKYIKYSLGELCEDFGDAYRDPADITKVCVISNRYWYFK